MSMFRQKLAVNKCSRGVVKIFYRWEGFFTPPYVQVCPNIMAEIAYESERNGRWGHWQFKDKPDPGRGNTTGTRRIIRSSLSEP
jgi:hypothetical protein